VLIALAVRRTLTPSLAGGRQAGWETMRAHKGVQILAVAATALLVSLSPSRAEDTKGKWQFGFGLSYYSTTDYIRSNSDLAISSGVVGENGLPSVGYVDDRPDGNVLNEPTIQDDFKLDFSASYGLTRWLALELSTSYLKAPVGNIEFFYVDVIQGLGAGGSPSTIVKSCGSEINETCYNYTAQTRDQAKFNTFLPVGEITEVPIHLSGLVRFRPESPFDPYIGLGMDYIITDLKTGPEFNARARQTSEMRVINASEGEFTDARRIDKQQPSPGFAPAPLSANVRNAFGWHAVGGVDYFVNEHFSFYVDARYVWTSGAVDIRTDGAHEVLFAASDFGRLLLTQQTTAACPPDEPNCVPGPYLWEDLGVGNGGTSLHEVCPTCQNDHLFETEDKNNNGNLDPDEDVGTLYQFQPGVIPIGAPDPRLPVGTIDCPACAGNGQIDTEDRNFNQGLDRLLLWGYDVCSTAQAAGNPLCGSNTGSSTVNHVWPEGCSTFGPPNPGSRPREGCPPPPNRAGDAVSDDDVTSSGIDNVADTFIIQGGRIRLGGFTLGVGVKFTF
jgi:opacity protein-like surface antigen